MQWHFLKTTATRYAIFSLKFTKNRLAAGLSPDLRGGGGLSAPPDSIAAIWSLLLREREGMGTEGGKGEREEESGRDSFVAASSTHSCCRRL